MIRSALRRPRRVHVARAARRLWPWALPVLVLGLAMSGPVGAWSTLGHRLVGELAQRQLGAGARAEVARLLAGEADPSLAGIAAWADTLRDTDPARFKQTARWHYVNFPRGECRYARARDCSDGNCVVAAIEAQRRILRDRRQPLHARRDALKFLVHLVADAHQPLHASDQPDKGGNTYQVSLRIPAGESGWRARERRGPDGAIGTNLHAVWDYHLLAGRRLPLREYAGELAGPAAPPGVDHGAFAVAAWAGESCRLIAAHQLYPTSGGRPTHRIDRDYTDAQRPLAERQIRTAATRLAVLLNETLGR